MSAYNAGGYANRPTSGLGSAGGANGDPSLPGGGGGIGGGGGGGGLYGSINDMLGQLMSGKMSRYGEDTTRRMKGQALEASKGQLNQNLSAINEEAARAGFSGSPQALALAAQQRSTAGNQYSSLVRDIENQKAQADYEDKVQGLNMAMDQVEKDRQYRLGEARNQIERDRIEADTAIARERIQSESDMLDRQLAAQQAMAARSAAAGAAGQGRAQAFQREMATMQHDWMIENRGYEMPFRLGQLGLSGGM